MKPAGRKFMENGNVPILPSGASVANFALVAGLLPQVQAMRMGANMRTKKILVVEDDKLVRSVLQIVLKRMGHRVLEAPDGASGLEVARAFHEKSTW
jgi:hypothetical protein